MSPFWDRSDTSSDNNSSGINLPGLGRLRTAVANLDPDKLPKKSTLVGDTTAGLTVTISMVPDGMANGLLAGVNPIYGLYANVIGPLVGGALTSSRLMVINNTSATALVAGQALVSEDREGPLFLMVMLAGLFAIAGGVARLGRLTRFVSFSVMTGFISGIAVVLIASQLPTITGVSVGDGNTITETFELVRNLRDTHLSSLGLALLTILVVVALPRLGLTRGASLVAIALPSLIVGLVGIAGVAIVQDVGDIPGGLPLPKRDCWRCYLPPLSFVGRLWHPHEDDPARAFAGGRPRAIQGHGQMTESPAILLARGADGGDAIPQGQPVRAPSLSGEGRPGSSG